MGGDSSRQEGDSTLVVWIPGTIRIPGMRGIRRKRVPNVRTHVPVGDRYSVSCETDGRVSPGETKCEIGRNPGEIAFLHHFFS